MTTDVVLEWKGRQDFRELEGRSIRLHFWLKMAELYSFWLDKKDSSTSQR